MFDIHYSNTLCHSPENRIFELFELGRMATANETKFMFNILLNLKWKCTFLISELK